MMLYITCLLLDADVVHSLIVCDVSDVVNN